MLDITTATVQQLNAATARELRDACKGGVVPGYSKPAKAGKAALIECIVEWQCDSQLEAAVNEQLEQRSVEEVVRNLDNFADPVVAVAQLQLPMWCELLRLVCISVWGYALLAIAVCELVVGAAVDAWQIASSCWRKYAPAMGVVVASVVLWCAVVVVPVRA